MGTSTFGTFTMARLGIYVSQQALNVTGNNISNINTTGYSRQELNQTAATFGGADRYITKFAVRESGGVLATGVNQLRDQYLDIRYRNEMTKVGEMEAKLDGLNQLADIFDEVGRADGDGVLEARFNDLLQQIENLHQPQNTDKDDSDGLVRKAAEKLVVQFNDYAKQLDALEETMDLKFRDEVNEVNTLLTKIRDLNDAIRRSEVFGTNALTQRDERNLLIDELSEKIGINVTYELERLGDSREVEKLVITTSGEPNTHTLIDGIYGAQLSIKQLDSGRVDDDGNAVMIDSPYYDLTVSALKNESGQTLVKDLGAMQVTGTPVLTAAETVPASPGEYSEEDAKALVAQLNDNAAFHTIDGTSYVYSAEQVDDTEAYHIVRRKAEDPSVSTYVNVSYTRDYSAEPAGGTPASYGSAADAQAVADALGGSGLSDDGSIFYYSVVRNGDAYEIHMTVTGEAEFGDVDLSGGLQAMRELLTEEGEYADAADLERDRDAGTKRGLPYYRQALDTLAREFAKQMNDANTLSDETVYEWRYKTDANGDYVKTDDGGFIREFLDKNGQVIPYTLDDEGNTVLDADDRSKLVLKPEYSYYTGGPLFADRDDSSGKADKDAANITAANISISYGWSHGSTRMLRTKQPIDPDLPQSTKQDNIDHFINLLTSEQTFTFGAASEGTTYFKGTFQEMLTSSIAGTLAKDQSITESMRNNYNATADELYVDRDAVMGVDLNDEAMNMMMFQKAYAAACRLMTTYDGMLDKLINGTAV